MKLDAIIKIDSKGDWEYEDEDFEWAKPKDDEDDWYTETDEYPKLYMCDKYDVVEYVDSLLEVLLPFESGTYHIVGDVNLYFTVTGIVRYHRLPKEESIAEESPVYDEEFDTDDADIKFEFNDSSINNFNIEKL